MVNRIKRIIEKENLTASTFADEIGVGRSTMNHILNGRNNPSLDVLVRIINRYKYISIEWLMLGTPPMNKGETTTIEPSLFDEIPVKTPNDTERSKYPPESEDKPADFNRESINNQKFIHDLSVSENIDKIIVFFKNKTFITLRPEE
jgi:transcriptional regulator with XRE-family HTH domain